MYRVGGWMRAMDYIEISGKTKEEAIIKASMQLETPSDKLDIQVVSEGSKGFLGFGSKPFVIRASKKEAEKEIQTEEKPDIEEKVEPEQIQSQQIDEQQREEKSAEQIAPVKDRPREYRRRESRQIEIITDEEQIEEVKKRAEEFLSQVFEAMGIEVHMESVYNNTDGSLCIDFSGENMGVLIGKRGQTLDSLQYLTGLVLNKGANVYVKVKLDTENYRARRRETLENLARGIAYKVRKTKKSVVLEPMNPYERRIIHSTLQGNRNVETFSEGEEPYRHIVVKPKGR